MTPLAHKVAREITLPVSLRSFDDRAEVLPQIFDAQFFECSDVLEDAFEVAKSMHRSSYEPDELVFLPAPLTWLEVRGPRGRFACLLKERTKTTFETSFVLNEDNFPMGPFISVATKKSLPLKNTATLLGMFFMGMRLRGDTPLTTELLGQFEYLLYALLAMINSPHAVDQHRRAPHAGLERELCRSIGNTHFKLRPWTELKLHIEYHDDVSTESGSGDGLRKALHFCRSHVRFRLGKLERVRGHWRGDASFGVVRKHYRVER